MTKHTLIYIAEHTKCLI